MTKTLGIPTEYRNYRFRSRLEAKWAAFFDLLNWRWEYEPFDCNGWIPDFALLGHKGHSPGSKVFKLDVPVLVEVKPIISFDHDVARKINAANDTHEVLLVGLAPTWEATDYDAVMIGWLRETSRDQAYRSSVRDENFWWDEALMREWGPDERENNDELIIGFCHSQGSYSDRITGNYDGNNMDGTPWLTREYLLGMWASAQNQTQWRSK